MLIYKQNLSIHHQQYLLWLMTWTNDLLTLILWLKLRNNISPRQETTWVSQVNELCLTSNIFFIVALSGWRFLFCFIINWILIVKVNFQSSIFCKSFSKFFAFCNLHWWWLSQTEKLMQKFEFWKFLFTIIYCGVFINYWLAFVIVNMNLNVLFTCILITTKLLFSTLLDYNFCFIHLYGLKLLNKSLVY